MSKLVSAEVMKQDEKPCLYIYEQTWRGRTQTGIVGCTAIDDYINNVIKKHEKTRADKEADRIRHVDTLDANTGPIFLTYRKNNEISSAVEDVKEKASLFMILCPMMSAKESGLCLTMTRLIL